MNEIVRSVVDLRSIDPALNGTGDQRETLFALRLSVIKMETEAIAKAADLMWFKKWINKPDAYEARKYLRNTVKNLKDAQARLQQLHDFIREDDDE